MLSVAHQAFDKCGRVLASPGSLADEAFRRHAAMALMRLGHMLLDSGVATTLPAAVVNRRPFMIVEDLDHKVG
jgi:hypothetical protein